MYFINMNIPIGLQLVKGSPVNCAGHEHIGLWLTTSHLALYPQLPLQGFIHFWLLHAWSNGHSALILHSGLQDGGDPINVGKQEQTA